MALFNHLSRRLFSTAASGAVDVHTHVYLPRYLKMLRKRETVPRIFTSGGQDRLIILPGEDEDLSTSAGRPIGTEYSDPKRKIAFMDMHGIGVSVLSLANPWLEFLAGKEASDLATGLNADLQEQCEKSDGRFYGFGVLPSDDVDASCRELERLAKMDRMRGIIVSARGLDDARLLPVYKTAEALGMVLFVHPHSGVGTEHFAGFGHALFLALGFPFETTTAVRQASATCAVADDQ
jgi:aminocarboxymuconate-semialdehyde decarboxylase